MAAPHRDAVPGSAPLGVGAVLRRRWAALAGTAVVALLWATGLLEDFSEGLVVAAIIYWVWGAVRGQLWRPGWFTLETAGVLGFGAVMLAALSLEPPHDAHLLAAGWAGHTVWDLAHYRANRIVPRWWAESCAVADLLIAAALLLLL
jgi:hypothetical protein